MKQINTFASTFATNGAGVIDAMSTVTDCINNTVHCSIDGSIVGLAIAMLYALYKTLKD